MDGVLLDSTAVHRRVWDAWSLSHGLDPETVWPLTFGRRPENTVADAAPHLDPVAERRVLDALLAREHHAIRPLPGAASLLGSLSRTPWAIVTSNTRPFVEPHFTTTGLPLPTVRVYGNDVVNPKPSPDAYTLAATRLAVPPTSCLVIEDAPAGVTAGLAAGCTVIGLTTTHSATELAHAHLRMAALTDVHDYLVDRGVLGLP